MADKEFDRELMRFLVAQLHVSNLLAVARDMFGKGYHSLSDWERQAVENAVWANVTGFQQQLTPELILGETTQRPVGFAAKMTKPGEEGA